MPFPGFCSTWRLMSRNRKFARRPETGERTPISRNRLHALFLRPASRLVLLALVLYICETGVFSLQQGSGPKEMGATIRTYWPRRQFTLRTESNLVEVGVVVRDSRGRTIGGLGKDDFEIEDAGRNREITAFSVETFTPIAAQPSTAKTAVAATEMKASRMRYVALLFDDFSMQFSQQVYVKAAARRFIKEGLAKGDRVGLFTTSGKQIVPFTADVGKLVAAIDQYTSFPRIPNGGSCPKLTPYDAYVIANKIDIEALAVKVAELVQCTAAPRKGGGGGGGSNQVRSFGSKPTKEVLAVQMQAEAVWTQVRDTSASALDTMGRLVDYMGQLPGKRMILLASSGFLVRTLELQQQKVISRALRAEVVINALDGKGLYTEEPPELSRGADVRSLIRMTSLGTREKDFGNDIMATLAMSTGGLFFDNNNDLDLGFRELGMVPEVSYLLGFSPEEAPDGEYHRLKVGVRSRNRYLIQARPGYWAVPHLQQEPSSEERRVDREVMGSGTLQELPALFASEPSKTDQGDPALDAVLHLDVGKFHFLEKDGVRTQKLFFIAALFDDSGNFVVGKETEIKFALKEPTYNRMIESGLKMSVTLQAPPGNYRLRGVAQDEIDGKIVTSTLTVSIR